MFLTPLRGMKKTSKGSMPQFVPTWSRNGRKLMTHHTWTLSPRASSVYIKPTSRFVGTLSFVLLMILTSSLAPPTQKKVYQALLAHEVTNKLAGLESTCRFTQFINDALHLEHDQYCQRTPQSTSHYSCHLQQSPIHPSTQTTEPPPAARDLTIV